MTNCCTPLTGIAVYAEDPRVIVSSYISAFLAWTILFKFDFISQKWRTISSTEISAYLHLLITIPPISMVIFYTYVQGRAGDIKEMMTAIVSICLALFHVGRTFWGLLQLEAFKDWCKDALKRMQLIGIRLSDEYLDFRRMILVNNSVVDNEFGGNELKVTLAPWKYLLSNLYKTQPSRILSTSEPSLCTLRWTAAFLCVYGHKLRGFYTNSIIDNLFKSCQFSLSTLLYVVIRKQTSKISESLFSGHEALANSSEKPGAYRTILPIYEFLSTEDRYELEFNNQLGNYPKESSKGHHGTPENVSTHLTDMVIFSKILDTAMLESFSHLKQGYSKTPICTEHGWRILLEQNFEFCNAGEENTCHHMKLPFFPWRALMIPLWDVCSNYRVLQASAHRDIFTALDNNIILEGGEISKESIFETSRKSLTNATKVTSSKYRFSGCVLESVRSLLARWVDANNSGSTVDEWLPKFQSNPTFVCRVPISEYCALFDEKKESSFRRDERLIWELQNALHSLVHGKLNSFILLHQLPCLVCLFLLGYPCLHLRSHTDEEDGLEIVRIEPKLKIQNVSVQVKLNSETKTGNVEIVFEGNKNIFDWQLWINSALGLMKGQDDLLKECSSDSFRERVIKEADLTKPMKEISAPNENFRYLADCSVKIWTGWPYFDIKICFFEMNNWLRAKNVCLQNDIDKAMLEDAEESLEYFRNNYAFIT